MLEGVASSQRNGAAIGGSGWGVGAFPAEAGPEARMFHQDRWLGWRSRKMR